MPRPENWALTSAPVPASWLRVSAFGKRTTGPGGTGAAGSSRLRSVHLRAPGPGGSSALQTLRAGEDGPCLVGETRAKRQLQVTRETQMRERGWRLTAERPVGPWKREDPTFAIWGVHVEATAVPPLHRLNR